MFLNDFEDELIHELELEKKKVIYVIMFREGSAMKGKIARVCDGFGKDRFEVPDNIGEKMLEITKMAEDTKRLVQATRNERKKVLDEAVRGVLGSSISMLMFQKWYIQKEKQLYVTLNMLKSENTFLTGVCWIPKDRYEEITKLLLDLSQKGLVGKIEKVEKYSLKPPTYVKVNEFTESFQQIVSTYGCPTYGEVNPAFFTIITFPLLFGVMFGDILHGFIVFCLSIYLCFGKDMIIKTNGIFKPLVPARYLLLLMGFFATFCGFLYNDLAGLSLMMFKSCYKPQRNFEDEFEVVRESNCAYPFGNDHFWKHSFKEYPFLNSYQMKISVIIAVLQMSLGVILKLVNSIHFGKTIDIIFEFLPQFIFLLALFGYMDLLIVMKWLTNYPKTNEAPSIITCCIDLFLGHGKDKIEQVFEGQKSVNLILLIILGVCVPWMMLPKPFILKSKHKNQAQQEKNKYLY